MHPSLLEPVNSPVKGRTDIAQQVIWMRKGYYGVVPAQRLRVVGPVGDLTLAGRDHKL